MNPLLPLSQSTGYAIQAMSCLEEPGGQPYLVQVVAECTGISPSYLSKVMQRLAQKGLIIAKRGKNGGVVLARSAREITLYDLAEAIDGATWKDHCVMGLKDCSDERPCELHELWKATRDPLLARMRTLTLAELAANHAFSAKTCRALHRGAKAATATPSCGCCSKV
jgi:Rrf2 family transcriptional regulator, iron-sulfur cluster assembly transcription factor